MRNVKSAGDILARKKEHLNIALDRDIPSGNLTNGLDKFEFIHQGLPEIDLADVDISLLLFGRHLDAPLVISPMVGGIEEAAFINRNLAEAAQTLGLAMGVGSQRCAIDSPENAATFRVRDVAPDILLFANLGAIQLNNGYSVDHCRKAVEMIKADGLVLHINPLQEALQPGGNTNFAGLLSKIEAVCRALTVPLLIKEVGFGISEKTAARLADVGISGIDVAGAGGTSFSWIERLRSHNPHLQTDPFGDWGIPTAESILMVRRAAPGLPLIASGGIKNGVEAAKAIALGADAVGMGGVLLRLAAISAQDVVDFLTAVIHELRTAMFCIGAADLEQLKKTPYLRGR